MPTQKPKPKSAPVKKPAAKKTAAKKSDAAPAPAKKVPAKKIAVKKIASAAVKKSAVKKVAPSKAVDKTDKHITEQKYLILKALDDGKAEDILDFDTRGRSSLADYIIIASGRSTRQVSSLAENISKALKQAGHKILHREGEGANDWVIVDTGDIIVHLLRPEVRSYYRLEDMWRL